MRRAWVRGSSSFSEEEMVMLGRGEERRCFVV